MAIPESQLQTWGHQGSIQQSSETYQTIRRALTAEDSGYADKSFEVFLQGSYGNDTNIYAESDVDIVIRLDSTFRYHVDRLSHTEQLAYCNYVAPATYSFTDFRASVIAQLQRRFGTSAVTVGTKAIKIKGYQNRRNADVVVCYEYRDFRSFSLDNPNDYVSGIIFPTAIGEIINYPEQHSANLTARHKVSGKMLKPMIRMLKNMRNRMAEKQLIQKILAPSYYIEGMVYNVPPNEYVPNSVGDTFCNAINWLAGADTSLLLCANQRYSLLGSSNVQWNEAGFREFLAASCRLWTQWS